MRMAESESIVSVRGLEKDFGDGDVLSGIDFDVRPGEITLLMGPNGVGKTILLSCIAGGLHADSGEITVFGDDKGRTKERLSFMIQGGMLVDELTGRENVSFFEDLHPHSTDQVETILDSLAFEREELEREVNDYSGGMKRKLEVAISLSVNVPLYLLDEPTAALDVTTIDRLHAELADRREAGDTVLMTSHLPSDADLADRVAFVTDTGITAEGPPDALLEDVPDVVLVDGKADIADAIKDGRFFEGEIKRRGFIREDVDPDTLTAQSDGARLEVRAPSYTDMFNYYVHLKGTHDE
jgi:ABC-type multidrug transport system ATPase subunit